MTDDFPVPPDATHVLAWYPPEFAPECPDGAWDLLKLTDFPAPGDGVCCYSRRSGISTSKRALTRWAAGMTGHAVSLGGASCAAFITELPGARYAFSMAAPVSGPGQSLETLLHWVIPAAAGAHR